MAICPKCNKEVREGSKFCRECGAPLEELVPESVSEEVPAAEDTPVEQPKVAEEAPAEQPMVAEEAPAEQQEETPEKPKNKFKAALAAILAKLPIDFRKKKVKIWTAVIAAVLVLVLVLSIVLSFLGRNNYVLYLKEGELMFSSLSNVKPFQVTEDSTTASAAFYTRLSKDEKRIFYLDDIESGVGKLYYREVNKPKKDAEKIDSDVSQFMINEQGNRVTYYKEGKLYQHNLKDREKLASDVKYGNWTVSKDGKNVLWLNQDGKAYFLKVGSDKEKVDSNITRILQVSEDCKTVWYFKDENLYVKESKKTKKKIASDVADVLCIYESGGIYFLKGDTETITLKDYVIDDMKESDAQMVEPVYPSWSEYYDRYEDYDQAWDAYDAAVDAYYEARDAWWDKEDRDDLRRDLEGETIEIEVYDLYFYNGKKVKTVAKNVDRYGMDYANQNATIVFGVFEDKEVEKVKISEVVYLYQIRNAVEDAFEVYSGCYVAVQDSKTKVNLTDVDRIQVADNGKMLYALCNVEHGDEGDLYKIAVSGKSLKKAEKIASDVCTYDIDFVDGNKLAYFKDVTNSSGTLYIDKKKIDSEVSLYSVNYFEDLKGITYHTDIDEDDDSYTLMMYKDKKKTEIAEDVHSFVVTRKGKIVYICDYNTDRNEGDLYLYDKKESKQIDDEVSRIIVIPSWND